MKGLMVRVQYMGVSKNRGGPPKSSILIGFSIIFTIHFGGFTPIFGNTHMMLPLPFVCLVVIRGG